MRGAQVGPLVTIITSTFGSPDDATAFATSFIAFMSSFVQTARIPCNSVVTTAVGVSPPTFTR